MLRIILVLTVALFHTAVTPAVSLSQNLLKKELQELERKIKKQQETLSDLNAQLVNAQAILSQYSHADEPLIGEVVNITYRGRVIDMKTDKGKPFVFLFPRHWDINKLVIGKVYNMGDCKQIDPNPAAPTYEAIITTVYERRWQEQEVKLKKLLVKEKGKLNRWMQQKELAGTFQLKDGKQLTGLPILQAGKIHLKDLKDNKRHLFSGEDLAPDVQSNSKLRVAWKKYRSNLTEENIAANIRKHGLEPNQVHVYRLANGRLFTGHVIDFTEQGVKMIDLERNKVADVRLNQLDKNHSTTSQLISQFQDSQLTATTTSDQ